ncbi:hypothetical protein [Dietzia cercidiphylli]|uniref:Uncharacterized protein n=1 Tax=Dietzia cercidiphylli TaxID=498199 RepID=A0ABP4VCV1_9ACTN|nr:hypothetical protein [Dietzia cercidiphylli]
MTSDEHKAAAEQSLLDAWGAADPTPELLRGLVHAVLATIKETS